MTKGKCDPGCGCGLHRPRPRPAHVVAAMNAGRAVLDAHRRVNKAIDVIEASSVSLTPEQCFRLWLVITVRSKGDQS